MGKALVISEARSERRLWDTAPGVLRPPRGSVCRAGAGAGVQVSSRSWPLGSRLLFSASVCTCHLPTVPLASVTTVSILCFRDVRIVRDSGPGWVRSSPLSWAGRRSCRCPWLCEPVLVCVREAWGCCRGRAPGSGAVGAPFARLCSQTRLSHRRFSRTPMRW